MGAMVAADVTVTIKFKDMTMRRCRNEVTVAFGDASATYPTHGIPLPAKKIFGLHSELSNLEFPPVTDNGYVCMFDKTYYTIRIFDVGSAGAMAEISGTVPTISMLATAYGT